MNPAALMILKIGRKRVIDGWCQGSFAKDDSGRGTTADDPAARYVCALGALQFASMRVRLLPLRDLYELFDHQDATRALFDQLPAKWMGLCAKYAGHANTIAAYNDATSKAAVVELFDRAIANLDLPQSPPVDPAYAKFRESLQTAEAEPA